MDLLAKVGKLLDGNKTYLVAVLTGGLGFYIAVTGHAIPEWVWIVLSAAGLGAVRSAIGSGAPK